MKVERWIESTDTRLVEIHEGAIPAVWRRLWELLLAPRNGEEKREEPALPGGLKSHTNGETSHEKDNTI